LWTIRGDKLEGEENRTTQFGAIVTVAIAFFIAEMGDKTQLMTIALATKFPGAPVFILLGTTTGMVIADGMGIVIGIILQKKIPERKVKLISAGIFILFGLIGSYQVLRNDFTMPFGIIIGSMILLILLTGFLSYYVIRSLKHQR
jgi:putative Ca2+/H+ antiporter (TMEM165/GDT1 family)